MSKVQTIADYFIFKANSSDKNDLTNKKLQKLLYYAQAWSLVLDDKKLFREDIEAWIHGPAIPSIYRKFKSFGFGTIEKTVLEKDLSTLTKNEKSLLDSIWKIYGQYDAQYLEALTHNEDPWKNARAGIAGFESSSNAISTEEMKSYYKSKLQEVS